MIDPIGPATSAAGGAGPAQLASAAPVRGPQAAASSVAPAPDFGAALVDAAMNAAGVLKAGEAAAISGIRGQASVQQVVEAVMAAEQTLNTAIAVRDKVVSAYLEISRMQI
jgi:flagellar hook-basal body complex protein FliE